VKVSSSDDHVVADPATSMKSRFAGSFSFRHPGLSALADLGPTLNPPYDESQYDESTDP